MTVLGPGLAKMRYAGAESGSEGGCALCHGLASIADLLEAASGNVPLTVAGERVGCSRDLGWDTQQGLGALAQRSNRDPGLAAALFAERHEAEKREQSVTAELGDVGPMRVVFKGGNDRCQRSMRKRGTA